jgi:uncharacterized metal-binding protein YceD (DUF177 family)
MNYLSKYEIAFKGLKEGHHVYEYDIDDKLFELYENSEVSRGKLKAEVKITKQSTLMILELSVKGKVELQCDHCLENYLQPIKNKHKLYVKFGSQNDEYDDVIVLSQDEYQINVAYYLYELIILGLPLRHIHPNEECDPEMVKKLNEYLVDQDVEPTEDNNPVDERWSELKKLLDNK